MLVEREWMPRSEADADECNIAPSSEDASFLSSHETGQSFTLNNGSRTVSIGLDDAVFPRFSLDDCKITVLKHPVDFHKALVHLYRGAKRRVVLAALYIGTSEPERQVLNAVLDACEIATATFTATTTQSFLKKDSYRHSSSVIRTHRTIPATPTNTCTSISKNVAPSSSDENISSSCSANNRHNSDASFDENYSASTRSSESSGHYAFDVDILIDSTRGRRQEVKSNGDFVSSLTMLEGLFQFQQSENNAFQQSPVNVNIGLFHSPLLSGLLYRVLPPRVNEVLGVFHTKVFLADDSVILTGANLSGSYLTDRQDRYILIENAPQLCNFLQRFIKQIQNFSYNATLLRSNNIANEKDCSSSVAGNSHPSGDLQTCIIANVNEKQTHLSWPQTSDYYNSIEKNNDVYSEENYSDDTHQKKNENLITSYFNLNSWPRQQYVSLDPLILNKSSYHDMVLMLQKSVQHSTLYPIIQLKLPDGCYCPIQQPRQFKEALSISLRTFLSHEVANLSSSVSSTNNNHNNTTTLYVAVQAGFVSPPLRFEEVLLSKLLTAYKLATQKSNFSQNSYSSISFQRLWRWIVSSLNTCSRRHCVPHRFTGEHILKGWDNGIRPLEYCEDESLIKFLVTHPIGDVVLASGYLNMASKLLDELSTALLNEENTPTNKLEVFVAAPEANSFFESQGLSKYIPMAYSYVGATQLLHLQKQLRQHKSIRSTLSQFLYRHLFPKALNMVTREEEIHEVEEDAAGFTKQIISPMFWEFQKLGWTFHSKGIWLYPREYKEEGPFATVVGSSNFGLRAKQRDFDVSFLLHTNDPLLRNQLADEVNSMRLCCKKVADVAALAVRCPRWLRFLLRYWTGLRSLL